MRLQDALALIEAVSAEALGHLPREALLFIVDGMTADEYASFIFAKNKS